MKKSHFGSVRRLPSGRYQGRYLDASGKRHSLEQTYTTEREARRALSEVEVGISRGDWVDPGSGLVTFAAFAADYLESREGTLQPTTISGYRSALKKWLLPTFGDMPLKTITRLDVDRWWGRLARQGVGGTVRRNAYSVLSGVMTAAVRYGNIKKSPCEIDDGFKDRSQPRPHLPAEDYARIIAQMPERYTVMFWTLLGAHLRLGELAGLNVGDFDATSGTLTVERQVSPTSGGVEMRPTKTGAVKKIKLLEPALGMLREYLADRAALPKAPLFTGQWGGRISRGTLRSTWNAARSAVGLEWAHMHDSRHTGLTIVAAHGTVKEVMERAGHTTAIASMRYQHVALGRDAAIADAASAALKTALAETA